MSCIKATCMKKGKMHMRKKEKDNKVYGVELLYRAVAEMVQDGRIKKEEVTKDLKVYEGGR